MPDMPTRDVDISPPTPPSTPERPNNGHGLLWSGVALVVVALAATGGWWGYGHQPQPAPPPPAPMKVQVITVVPRTVGIYRSFPATTEAIRSVAIQARVTGYLTGQGAADGTDVAAGDLLYRIDARDYQVALAQAQASVGQATASLDYSRVSNGRNQVLARQGWVPQDTADQTMSTYHQGQASLASNNAAARGAALNLGRTEVVAPFAGRTSRSQVFLGTLISVAGTTLNTLNQLDPIYVTFNPAEADLAVIGRTQAQAPIQAAVSVGGAAPNHAGVVTFIDNQVDHTTGTILVRATIANADHILLPGQYVTARLHLGDRSGALLVPQTAVGAAQIGRYLLLVGTDGKTQQRIVKLGDTDGDDIVVTDGLKPGERVIIGQLQKLRPGIPVAIEATAAPPP